MNIWSEKKRIEKINYMHYNPVKRGLVAQPGDWPWSRRGGEVLLPGGQVDPGDGSDAVNAAREKLGTHTWKAMYAPPATDCTGRVSRL
jgi:hypothetical protein